MQSCHSMTGEKGLMPVVESELRLADPLIDRFVMKNVRPKRDDLELEEEAQKLPRKNGSLGFLVGKQLGLRVAGLDAKMAAVVAVADMADVSPIMGRGCNGGDHL